MGDDAADAVIDFAVALGRKSTADAVYLEVLNHDGKPEHLSLLVGPATMISVETVTVDYDEPDNNDEVLSIRARILTAQPPHPMPSAERPNNNFIDEV